MGLLGHPPPKMGGGDIFLFPPFLKRNYITVQKRIFEIGQVSALPLLGRGVGPPGTGASLETG